MLFAEHFCQKVESAQGWKRRVLSGWPAGLDAPDTRHGPKGERQHWHNCS